MSTQSNVTNQLIPHYSDGSKSSAEQRLLYKVYALFEPEKLPAYLKKTSDTPKKSATPELLELIHELTSNYSTLTASTKAEVEKYISFKRVGNSIKVEYSTDLEG